MEESEKRVFCIQPPDLQRLMGRMSCVGPRKALADTSEPNGDAAPRKSSHFAKLDEVAMKSREGLASFSQKMVRCGGSRKEDDAPNAAVVKIQAATRGRQSRVEYRERRDTAAWDQWVAYYVQVGDFESAKSIGWDPDKDIDPVEAPQAARAVAAARSEGALAPAAGAGPAQDASAGPQK